MTQTACRACTAATDAPLCRDCTRELHDTLKRLPSLIDELQVTAAKQARIGDIPRRQDTEVGSIVAYLALRQKDWPAPLPPLLRALTTALTLASTPTPVNLAAAQLHRQAVSGLADWLTHIEVDPEPVPPIVRTDVIIRRNRAQRLRVRRAAAVTPQQWADWLAGHAQRFRMSEHGPEVHAKALDLVATIEATIDRRDPDVFAGLCDATGVHVHQLRITGPACTGLTCPHPSCEAVRQERAMISAVAGECGGELAAPTGATEVDCPRCGTRYDIADQRAKVADRIADRLGTVREVTGFLRSLELDVTVDKIDGWLRRGRIVDHGTGPTGRLVRVGEVRAYAEAQAERAKNRRRERISA